MTLHHLAYTLSAVLSLTVTSCALTPLHQYERSLADSNIAQTVLPSQPHEPPTYMHKDTTHPFDAALSSVWSADAFDDKAYESVTAGDIKAAFIDSLANAYTTITSSLNTVQSTLSTTHTIEQSATDAAVTDGEYYGYFRWIPRYLGTLPIDDTQQFASPCFTSTIIKYNQTESGAYQLILDLSMPENWHCSDMYMFATLSGTKTESFYRAGVHVVPITFDVKHNLTESEVYDITKVGVRVFRFLDSSSVHNAQYLKDTLALFSPLTTQMPSDDAEKRNRDFMRLYATVDIQPRTTAQHTVTIDANDVQSGDFFGVMRLDGLDPMLAWAMGSVTGHVTMALRIGAQLYIVESTTKDSYWPTNGIQKTEYYTWMKQAQAAGFNVVYAPLSSAARATFSEEKAVEYFKTIEGYDYGYQNLLYAWIDTLEDNYPCLPDQLDACLTWQHVEIIVSIVERQSNFTSQRLFVDAFNQRLNTRYTSIADVLHHADVYGQLPNRATLPTIVESDLFVYNLTRFDKPSSGPSMVCCVFVCNMWKHAGVFDQIGADSVNCAELTNWDDYALTVLDDKPARPTQCTAADPDNVLCQLEGKWQLQLNNYATRDMYQHMAEKCPSRNPQYYKPKNC